MARPPDPFRPFADPPSVQWRFWKAEFKNFLAMKQAEATDSISSRLATLKEPTNEQKATLDRLKYTDERKLRDLFVGLGSEGFRQFLAKTGWDMDQLGDKTIADAFTALEELFGEKKHPILSRWNLYRATKKSRETYEEFVIRLRQIAVDCRFEDDEAGRIWDALITSCQDETTLRKIMEVHPCKGQLPTLNEVLTTFNLYESAARDSSKHVRQEHQAIGGVASSSRLQPEATADDLDSGSETSYLGHDEGEDSVQVLAQQLAAAAMGKSSFKKGTGFNKNYTKRKKVGYQFGSKTPNCYGCGSNTCPRVTSKQPQKCPAANSKCTSCHKIGHFTHCCKSHAQISTVGILNSSGDESSSHGDSTNIRATSTPQPTDAENGQARRSTSNFEGNGMPNSSAEDSREVEFQFQAGDEPIVLGKLLVDSGADVSTIKEHYCTQLFPRASLLPTKRVLSAFNGQPTRAKARLILKVSYNGGPQRKILVYVVPDACTRGNLLGYFDMEKMGLRVVDTSSQRWTIVAGCHDVPEIPHEADLDLEKALLDQLREKYPSVFGEEIGMMRNFKHTIQLKPGAIPVRMAMRRIPFAKEKPTADELDRCINLWRIMEKVPNSKSEWSSPMHGVSKPGGDVRVTTDYSRTINPNIIPTLHPTPLPAEIFHRAKDARVISKVDLIKAFWHLLLAEESRILTAFSTPSHGLLQYTRLPMGMTDSAAAFQRTIEQCLAGLKNVAPYIDDILVWGKDQEEHDKVLDQVFARLDRDGFRVSEKKCALSRQEVTMLGQKLKVTESGLEITPDPSKTAAVQNAQAPSNLKELQRFLGMAGYFSPYINNYATIAEPLNRLKRKTVKFDWTTECERAFQTIKEAIASPQVLVPFDPSCEVHVQTDASIVGLGACLFIERSGSLRPVAFASKLLTTAERNYSTPEQEALATVWALEKFNQYLFGRPFTLHSDQSSLATLMQQFGDKPTVGRRIQRWYERLRHYDYKLKHISGSKNVVADYLSRLNDTSPPSTTPTLPDDSDDIIMISALRDTTLSLDNVRAATRNDSLLKAVSRYLASGWPQNEKNIAHPELKRLFRVRDEISESNGFIFRGDRLLVPACHREHILDRLHIGHPGIVRMKQLYADLYYWPTGLTDCEEKVTSCVPCTSAEKSSKPVKVPTGESYPPEAPWQVLSLDITGPFWEAPKRHENIVVLMDYFSKWPELLFTNRTTSYDIIKWLKEVFYRYGNPLEIVKDNGPQFTSDEFEAFLASRQIKHTLTPVYCPQRNGLVERFNRVIKNAAQIFDGRLSEFKDHIMETVSSFRSIAPQGSKSPAILLHGWNLRSNADIRNPRLEAGGVDGAQLRLPGTKTMNLQDRAEIVKTKAQNRTYAQNRHTHKPSPYTVNDIVQCIRPKAEVRKGQSPLSRPMRIVAQHSKWDYLLSDGNLWNARKLRRYRPAYLRQPLRDFDFDHVDDHTPNLRRSERLRQPPKRLIEEK